MSNKKIIEWEPSVNKIIYIALLIASLTISTTFSAFAGQPLKPPHQGEATMMATESLIIPTSTPYIPTSTPPPPTLVPLSLTGVEPGRVERETGGNLSIFGSGFTPAAAVRLVGQGLLDVVFVNSTALRAVVPPRLPAGTYDLQVSLGDGMSATLPEAVKIVRPKEATVTPTSTPALLLFFGQPQLLIESAQTQPETVKPGEAFILHLKIANQGDYTATALIITLTSLDLAVPVEGSNIKVVEQINYGESTTVDIPLVLDQDLESGYHNLNINLSYSDFVGREFNSIQTVGLDISTTLAGQPLVLLSNYATEPETLTPGDTFTLKLELANVGGSNAKQMTITLGKEGVGGLNPFALIGAGNVQYVPVLTAGTTLEVEQQLTVDGSANSGLFDIPIVIAYDENQNSRLTQNQVVTLMVRRLPRLQINFYRPVVTGVVGEPLTLPVEVINISRDLVNVSTLEISAEGMEIREGSVYLGALDGGFSGSLDGVAIPQRGGRLPIQVTVSYLDDFNQPQTIVQELSVFVEEPVVPDETAPEEEKPEEEGFWDRIFRFLGGLFGLGS